MYVPSYAAMRVAHGPLSISTSNFKLLHKQGLKGEKGAAKTQEGEEEKKKKAVSIAQSANPWAGLPFGRRSCSSLSWFTC